MSRPVVERTAVSWPRRVARIVLGAFLLFTGVSHLSFGRTAFLAQVPPWLPVNADVVIIASGVVEIALGASLVLLTRWQAPLGWGVALFFVLVFPGNISQFITHANAFGLDSDLARGIRLLFQPLLVILALWCTGAWAALREGRSSADRHSRKGPHNSPRSVVMAAAANRASGGSRDRQNRAHNQQQNADHEENVGECEGRDEGGQ